MSNMEATFDSMIQDIQLIIDNLKDMNNEGVSDQNYVSGEYWGKMDDIVKAVSACATKLCIAFNEPPVPSPKDCEPIFHQLKQCVVTLAACLYNLPKSRGVTLQKRTQTSVICIITATKTLVEVIKTDGCQGSQSQRSSTGNVWQHCDSFPTWPKDNQQAALATSRESLQLVQDALQEIEEAKSSEGLGDLDDLDEMLGEDEEAGGGEPQETWTDNDKALLAPCVGLIKTAKNCLKKVTMAVENNGGLDTALHVSQLDGAADRIGRASPLVDDFVSVLYPPMLHTVVLQKGDELSSELQNLLSYAKHSHFTTEDDQKWVELLDKAVLHNQTKMHEVAQNVNS